MLKKLLVAVIGLTLCSAASGQERHQWRTRLETGQRWAFERLNQVELQMQGSAPGVPPQQIRQRMSDQRKGLIDILDSASGTPTAIRLQLDPSSVRSVELTGQPPMQQPHAAVGQLITARRSPDGRIDTGSATLDAESLKEISAFFETDKALCPPRPVAVGEEWNVDTQLVARDLGLSPGEPCRMTCSLAEVSNRDGRQTARLIVMAQFSKNEGGIRMECQLKGVAMLDVASGQVVELDLNGQVTVSGTVQAPLPDGNMMATQLTGSGQAQFRGRARCLNCSPTNPTPIAAPAAPALASNPLGGDDATGRYVGEEIRVELRHDGGSFRGQIESRGRTFPMQATVRDGRIAGKFEADGASFEFEGSIAGGVLRLATGGKTHTLQRIAEGPANPLGNVTTGGSNPLGETLAGR